MGDIPHKSGGAEPGGSAGESWRSWLMTGARGSPVDPGRVRGANRGVKQILSEGSTGPEARPRPWKDFSGAMTRQAVNEAMSLLPQEHKEVVKLAYFGGFSNREIAQHLGLSVGSVQRKLRQALAHVSEYVERGRAVGRRAIFGLPAWLSARTAVHSAQRMSVPWAQHTLAAVAVAGLVVTGAVSAGTVAREPGVSSAQHQARIAGAPGRDDAAHVAGPNAPASPAGASNPMQPPALAFPVSLPVQAPQLPPLPLALPSVSPPALPSLPSLPPLPATSVQDTRA